MTNKPELTDERIHEILLKFTRDSYRLNGTETGMALGDAVFALRELQERRKADSAEPVAWLHSDNGIGIPAITRSRNIADSWFSKGWNIKPLYTAPQPAPEREQVRRDYTEDVNSKQSVKIGIYERIYGPLRECPGTDSIYSVAPIEGECIPHGVLAHIGCISFYCNLGHLHIAEPVAFTGCHTHSLSGGAND
ncbi:TPA: hypothetical protein MD734_002787 [Citrobacter freundii]|nr:hypothetical protein [Citrobacter freundii]MBA7974792.1 hypothetical protein [Citrobacter freundii]MDX7391584.1 hypothetical protein [Citrobacter freundii]HBN5192027.1 hypothetical protein [Citrobacter freundii]HBU6547763.1 hypothetical protein [Citrobacter freundii]HBU7469071.1 hypothetical protein [Citrobacter freundii]